MDETNHALTHLRMQLEEVIVLVKHANERIKHMSNQIQDLETQISQLTTQVAASVTVEQSALTLIQGINAQLAAAGTDAAKLADLRAQLMGSAESLSAAVAANTVAASPVVSPVPVPTEPAVIQPPTGPDATEVPPSA